MKRSTPKTSPASEDATRSSRRRPASPPDADDIDAAKAEATAAILADFGSDIGRETEARALIDMYRRTRNGWFFWKGYLEYRRLGQPVPEALMKKLDQIAQRLIEAEGRPQIAMAVEMSANRQGPQGKALAQRTMDTREIVQQVHDLLSRRRLSKDAAVDHVAKKLGKTERQVAEMYDAWMRPPKLDSTAELDKALRKPTRSDS